MQTEAINNTTTVLLGEQGQMVLPKEFRETQQLEPGDPITVLQFGNQLILIPEKATFAELTHSIATQLEQAGIDEQELLEGLQATREAIARERYPELFSSVAENNG